MRISVQVDADSQLCARKVGQRMEVTVSDPFGHTVVTLDLPGAEFMRLVTAMSDAWNGAKK